MNYQFDMTRLTIGDYLNMQTPAQPTSFLGIAGKCSLTDVANIPITELTAFMQDFSKALGDYISTQFPPVK